MYTELTPDEVKKKNFLFIEKHDLKVGTLVVMSNRLPAIITHISPSNGFLTGKLCGGTYKGDIWIPVEQVIDVLRYLNSEVEVRTK